MVSVVPAAGLEVGWMRFQHSFVPRLKYSHFCAENPLHESRDSLNGISQTPTHAPLAGQIFY